MADRGYIEALLAGVKDTDMRRAFIAIFKYLLADIRFGRAEDGESSKNMGGGFFTATTPAVANEEFAVPHSFERSPYLLIPVLPLNKTGATIVPLRVERPADAANVYLSSSETEQPVYFFLEG